MIVCFSLLSINSTMQVVVKPFCSKKKIFIFKFNIFWQLIEVEKVNNQIYYQRLRIIKI